MDIIDFSHTYDLNFYFNLVRFQIVSFSFLIVLEFFYFKRRKLPLASTRLFTTMMIVAGIYIFFDFLSAYCVVFIDQLPRWFVRLAHQFFILSINTIFLLCYIYIDNINNKQNKLKKVKFRIITIIYCISILIVAFGRLFYKRTPTEVYSFGPMAQTIFVLSSIFAIMIIIQTIRVAIKSHKKSLDYGNQFIILGTMIIWVLIVTIQFLFPHLLISGVGITMFVFLMYMSLENPLEYIDSATETFNAKALERILREKMKSSKSFYIINLDFENLPEIANNFSDDAVSQIMRNVVIFFTKKYKRFTNAFFKLNVYRSTKNSLTIIIDEKRLTRNNLQIIYKEIEETLQKEWTIDDVSIKLHTHLDVIHYPEDTKLVFTASQMMNFIENCHTYTVSKDFIRSVDRDLIQNKYRRDTIISIIKDAIANDGIEMFFQPIFSISDNAFTNAEGLVRLKDSETVGFISPEEFIPLAERNGLIMPLSSLIFEKVFSFMQKNSIYNYGLTHMELNLSAIQSIDSNLPRQIKELLEKYSISPNSINLEITESIAISSTFMLNQNMEALKAMGCSFSMDDFGTGYSNLAQMANIDYQFIKLDKSLIWPCFDQQNSKKELSKILLTNIVSMILSLNRKIVAEGVETREQFEFLKSIGVNYIQGYFFSKPLNQEQYLAFLKKHNT